MPKARFLLAGLLKLCVAAACVVGAIAAFRLLAFPLIERAFAPGEGASTIVRRVGVFLSVVLPYWGFVHFYERRPARELRIRGGWTLLGGAAGALSIGITILVLYATGHYEVRSFRGFGQAFGVLGPIAIAATLEEVLFRGILFRILEERLGIRAALIGSAVVFGAVHLSNNGAHAITLLTVTLAGLMWAGVYILSRNIWVVAAHHCCWNATIFASGAPLSGEEDWRAMAPLETVRHGADWWTGGDFGPEDSPVNLVVMLAICVATWHLARRMGRHPENAA